MPRAIQYVAFALAGLLLCSCPRRAADGGALPVYEIHVVEARSRPRLLRGFQERQEAWLWTGQSFAVSLDLPPDRSRFLVLNAGLPGQLFEGGKTATLKALVNGRVVGARTFAHPENFVWSAAIPDGPLGGSPAEIAFELDRPFRDLKTGQARGIIVVSVGVSDLDVSPTASQRLAEATRENYERVRQLRNTPATRDQDRQLMSIYHETPIWRSFWFHSILCEKNPLDLWVMQDLIWRIRPEFIIETGTLRGGSALFWANTLNGIGLTGSKVLTVDITDFTQEASCDRLWSKYVEFYHGSSTDASIVAGIAAKVRGHRTLITLDSDHSAQHVLRELRLYSPLVSRDSYIVVEDSGMDGVPTYPGSFPGPLAAVTLFLKEGGEKEFLQDASREQMGITFNPGGWLRRK
jgi:cephalosporin hydroxylase